MTYDLALKAARIRPRSSIERIMVTAEEPTRFSFGCLGSRIMAGIATSERLARLRDPDGRRPRRRTGSVRDLGFDHGCSAGPGSSAAFFGAVEQGPELERTGVPIGVVTAIAAPALRVESSGEGGHAGAVLMAVRHDPLVAAADVIQAVDRLARSSGSAPSAPWAYSSRTGCGPRRGEGRRA